MDWLSAGRYRYLPKKVDSVQAEIAEALRACGASILYLHSLGHGAPDLCVGLAGGLAGCRNVLLEIKSGESGKLTPSQIEWHASWRGQVAIARSIDEALTICGIEVIG